MSFNTEAMKQIDGTKLPPELENPFDVFMSMLASSVVDVLHSAGITPNMVTLASFLCAVAALWCFANKHPIAAMIFWIANYYCDTLDGIHARVNNLESVIGDAADHATDVVSYLGLFCISAYFVVWKGASAVPLVLGVVLSVAAVFHMSCQELHVDGQHMKVAMLDRFLFQCKNSKSLRWTRWVGVGTANLFFLFMIWYYSR